MSQRSRTCRLMAVMAAATVSMAVAHAGERAFPPPPPPEAPLPRPAAPTNTFEAGPFVQANRIDALVLKVLKAKGIKPANLCSDAVFIRRAYIDVIGTLPEAHRVRRFFASKLPNKRALLIDELMKRKEFADYWAQRWGDILRIKAEFPINLWPNGVQAYARWVHDAVRTNMPYDKFARALLTSSGSNFRVPQVNFYRAIQGQEPATMAAAAALTFMGARMDKWPKARQDGMTVFFSRVALKGTAEWKEQIIMLDPAPVGPLKAVFPDGKKVTIPPDKDPRAVFADWLLAPGNEWFARSAANRVWAWLLGRGIIHEPDDIRADNPAAQPEVLAYLQKELVKSRYDLQHIYRLILNSSTYQQSSIPRGDTAEAEKFFACYPVRQLDAEVLIDALNAIAGGRENYSSVIPEPFTFVPTVNRTIALEDGSITSQFLEMFGRPARDTGMHSERSNTPTEAQRLHLLNSSTIQNKLSRGWRLKQLQRASKGKPLILTNMIYLNVLSRRATPKEMAVAGGIFKVHGRRPTGPVELTWALINTKEFLYRH
jgi:Protein of unknown function (DUF1553)/Protein of unknown function (DUF1549)